SSEGRKRARAPECHPLPTRAVCPRDPGSSLNPVELNSPYFSRDIDTAVRNSTHTDGMTPVAGPRLWIQCGTTGQEGSRKPLDARSPLLGSDDPRLPHLTRRRFNPSDFRQKLRRVSDTVKAHFASSHVDSRHGNDAVTQRSQVRQQLWMRGPLAI